MIGGQLNERIRDYSLDGPNGSKGSLTKATNKDTRLVKEVWSFENPIPFKDLRGGSGGG